MSTTPNSVLDDSGYRDRYVAFLDILGFSELTQKADGHPNWRAYLRDCIDALGRTLPSQVELSGFRFVQFSDAIVLSADRNFAGLAAVINGCTMLFINMLNRGILLRGGIAAGNFHHDDRMMFGPALIRAHAYDQRGAPPHVVLDAAVLEDMKPSLLNPSALDYVTYDPWDLTPMLHTLKQYGDYDGIPKPGLVVLEGNSVGLARTINAHATDMSQPPAVRAKWRWMEDYWNRSVATKGLLARSQFEQDWTAVAARLEEASRQRLAAFNVATVQVPGRVE